MAKSALIVDEQKWARVQTNTALQDEGAVSIARNLLNQHKIPLQGDRWKNWDQYLAIYHAARLTNKDESVLDAGACRDPAYPSTFLPGLQKLGFTSLHGCNLDEGALVVENNVKYQYGDVTASPYADARFAYVACLSVLEHGVDWRKFYIEMSRIIKAGGHLFVSFDYWVDPIDVGDRMAFGAPVKVFNKPDVMTMALFAHQFGLHLTKVPVFECKEPLVKWMGLEYTFFNLLFQRR